VKKKASNWLKDLMAPVLRAPADARKKASTTLRQTRSEIRAEFSVDRIKSDLTARATAAPPTVQCLIFPASTRASDARALAKQRGVRVRTVRLEGQRLILEQSPADHFEPGSLRTRAVGDGVLEVVGEPRPAGEAPRASRSGRPSASFSAADVRAGTRAELQHTSSPELAREIALDRLAQDPTYYRRHGPRR